MSCKTLVEAIYDRYNEMPEEASHMMASSPDSSSEMNFSKSFEDNSIISFYIPASSPRKTQSGVVVTSCSLVMSNQNINSIGDIEALKRSCKNVVELDLSKNQFDSWDEVKKLFTALKQLRLLNLSHNPLPIKFRNANNTIQIETESDVATVPIDNSDYFHDFSALHHLKILILNSCPIELSELQHLLDKLVNLNELHLCSNNYKSISFDKDFRKQTLKILYLSNNQFESWNEVCKLGIAFPNLDTLVISDNNIADFTNTKVNDDEIVPTYLHTSESFKNLQQLIINKILINEWSTIDQLRDFPRLKHVRLQNIPLLESYTDEEKYFFLVAHLEGPTALNGSEISEIEKENCERKYIRYHMDRLHKPQRYYELESRHGKLNKLADINLEATNKVLVKIKYNDTHICEYVDVRLTVGEFKKHLEKYVGCTSNKFRLFYIDIEALGAYGPEELKHSNRCLHSFNIRDGDEFEIDLKQPYDLPHVAVRQKQKANRTLISANKNSISEGNMISGTKFISAAKKPLKPCKDSPLKATNSNDSCDNSS